MDLLNRLPDWSRTADPKAHLNDELLRQAAIAFVTLGAEERMQWVREFSAEYCLPQFDQRKASGIYLLFRLAFNLPTAFPRNETKVFGGWLHISTTKPDEPFNLSWPVAIDQRGESVRIDRFRGYRGKGYDAIGEYEYFSARFHLRSAAVLTGLKFVP